MTHQERRPAPLPPRATSRARERAWLAAALVLTAPACAAEVAPVGGPHGGGVAVGGVQGCEEAFAHVGDCLGEPDPYLLRPCIDAPSTAARSRSLAGILATSCSGLADQLSRAGCPDGVACAALHTCPGETECNPFAFTDSCQSDEFCSAARGAECAATLRGMCVPKKADGDLCVDDGECQGGICEGYQCRALRDDRTEGESCADHAECAPGFYCAGWISVARTCQPQRELGARCWYHDQCESGWCPLYPSKCSSN